MCNAAKQDTKHANNIIGGEVKWGEWRPQGSKSLWKKRLQESRMRRIGLEKMMKGLQLSEDSTEMKVEEEGDEITKTFPEEMEFSFSSCFEDQQCSEELEEGAALIKPDSWLARLRKNVLEPEDPDKGLSSPSRLEESVREKLVQGNSASKILRVVGALLHGVPVPAPETKQYLAGLVQLRTNPIPVCDRASSKETEKSEQDDAAWEQNYALHFQPRMRRFLQRITGAQERSHKLSLSPGAVKRPLPALNVIIPRSRRPLSKFILRPDVSPIRTKRIESFSIRKGHRQSCHRFVSPLRQAEHLCI